MGETKKMTLKILPTGVPGLDEVFGGGLPEYSFNLLAGPPGSGKTTLVHQFTFANASADRPALYFTVVGEPPIKMLRYQQQMEFFDAEKIGTVIKFVDLSPEVLDADLGKVLDKILENVKEQNPAIVVVDSFRTVLRTKSVAASEQLELQAFVQQLALHLTSWQITSFLVGEYSEHEVQDNPVFTVADGIFWLTQGRDRNSIVRKLEVTKLRGVAPIPGLHTFRISSSGIQVFPRTTWGAAEKRQIPSTRTPSGVPGLDEMLGGGFLAGDATLVAGPSGTGKTVMSTQFIAAGVERGECGVLAIFEEHPQDYLARAKDIGLDLEALVDQGKVRVVYLRPLDLSAEEILHQIQEAVAELDAKRLVIDSLNGFELALAPNFRDEFRDSLYRLMGRLTGKGVSILLTVEVMESFEEIKFSPHAVSFLSQNILFLRYVEIESELRKMIMVIKMRRSDHSKGMREYEITTQGMRMTRMLSEYDGVLRGTATLRKPQERTTTPGLTDSERAAFDKLSELDEVTAEEMAVHTGRSIDEVARALDRIVALNYGIKVVDQEQTVYRAAERPLGGRSR